MTKYVLGFMFNVNETDVLLIEKQKPQWQRGKLNGVGGKIEGDEPPLSAMIREFKEETGIYFIVWNKVVEMIGDDWIVYVYTAKSDDVFYAEKLEIEQPILVNIKELDNYELISNLYWLIEMCLDNDNINYSIKK